jgi:phosphoribosyl 1,2-cyclic phosphate phosphodiesterase
VQVKILGCGGSGGVPLMNGTTGGNWGNCDPGNPKNRRRRVSILVSDGDTNILVDASPDLREQCLTFGVGALDAVLITHDHADHCHGLDDLRAMSYRLKRPIPVYMDDKTSRSLLAKFAYAFVSSRNPESIYRAILEDRLIEGPFMAGTIPVRPFVQKHGPETCLGLRFGNFAYSTDISEMTEEVEEALDGVHTWVVDCLRDRPHPTHSHSDLTFEWIRRIKPKRAVLTHMNQELDYEDIRARCPAGVEPAYDGLCLEVPD